MSNPSTYARLSCALLPGMKREELDGLKAWARYKAKQGRYVILCQWITDVIDEEIKRRESDGLAEPQMIVIPPWQPQELADCLLGTLMLSRSGLTQAMGRFADEVLLMLVVDAHCILGEVIEHHAA